MDDTNNKVQDMKKSDKKLIAGAVIAVVLLISGIYLYAGVFKKPLPFPTPPQTAQQVKQAAVKITAAGFMPATLEISKDTAVTWTNIDQKSHQIASDPHPTHTLLPELVSDPLLANDSFAFIFDKTGIFTFHDHLNPLKLRGTVIVK